MNRTLTDVSFALQELTHECIFSVSVKRCFSLSWFVHGLYMFERTTARGRAVISSFASPHCGELTSCSLCVIKMGASAEPVDGRRCFAR